MQRICDFIAKWMGVIVLLVAALSLVVPSSLAWIGTWVINPMLGVIMFGMGLTLSANDLKIVLSRPRDIFIGCLTQFTVMPLLAWCLTKTFSLPQELAIGVILVGCCPGGTASNVITYLAKGDLALSVGMTAASTLLAPILTPLLVWLLAGTMVDVHTTGMLMSIVYIVILPIVCGLLCQRFIPKITQRVTPYLPAFSSLAVALTVGIVVSHNADRLMTAGLLVVLVVMLHNLFGLGIGYLVGQLLRLQRPKSVALSIEVGMQNSGLATSLAVMHFAAFPLATIPGAVFSVWHNISGAIIARIYSRHATVRKPVVLVFFAMLLLVACNRPAETFIPAPPDYQDTTMWITLDGDTAGTGADIFYVVSTWEQDWKHDSLVCHYADVWNPEHRAHMAIEIRRAAAYMSPGSRFYAPFYRHTTIDGWVTRNEDTIYHRTRLSMDDVCRAFDTFIAQRDNSRPLVIAGFSQGGLAVVELLKHMSDETFSQLVAAYVMGYKLTPQDTLCPHIRPAQGETDTHVTICYNTVKDVRFIQPVIAASCVCINPVNWRTDATPAMLHDTITVSVAPEHVLVVSGYSGSEYPPFAGFINVGDIHSCEPWLYSDCIRRNIQARTQSFRNL